ncbi:MAG: ABC transporter permease subunit [Acidimicrobiales bacterium]
MAQLEFLIRSIPSLIWGVPNNRPGGLVMSLLLSFAGLSFGLVLATGLGLARAASVRAVRAPATALVRVIRGIPLILLLLVVQRAVVLSTGVGGRSSSIIAAVVALTLYAAAYQTDIIEAGLRAVPQALIEEAALLGAGPLTRYFSLRLPYGLRVMRPALLSQTITLFKDSSVVVVLGVADLTTTARLILGSDVGNAPYWVGVYLTVGFIYFCVSFLLSRMTIRIEGSAARIGLLVNNS